MYIKVSEIRFTSPKRAIPTHIAVIAAITTAPAATSFVHFIYSFFSFVTASARLSIAVFISSAKKTATPSVAMGIDALMLMNDGYTAKEIGVRFGKTTNTITALVSKAKKHLRAFPELQLLYGESV